MCPNRTKFDTSLPRPTKKTHCQVWSCYIEQFARYVFHIQTNCECELHVHHSRVLQAFETGLKYCVEISNGLETIYLLTLHTICVRHFTVTGCIAGWDGMVAAVVNIAAGAVCDSWSISLSLNTSLYLSDSLPLSLSLRWTCTTSVTHS